MKTNFDEVIGRHERIALQFSGGKDSIAILEMLRPYWDKLTVYWLNTGDAFPEVEELVAKVRAAVPHFVEVAGDREQAIAAHGLPTDVLPYSSTANAYALQLGDTPRLQDRFQCCALSIMWPMGKRMEDDGITLVIRGQRHDERYQGAYTSGDVIAGKELLFPIEDWTTEQVLAYIKDTEWGIPRYYLEGMPHSGDCMTCTAWLGDGRAQYLKKHYPKKFEEYVEKIAIIATAAEEAVNNLINEVEACRG